MPITHKISFDNSNKTFIDRLLMTFCNSTNGSRAPVGFNCDKSSVCGNCSLRLIREGSPMNEDDKKELLEELLNELKESSRS